MSTASPGRARKKGARQAPTTTAPTLDTIATPTAAVPAPPRLRRRPIVIALAIALVASGALLAAYLVTALGNTTGVVAVRADIERGSVIQRADLVEARINPDPALLTVPSDQIESLVGKRAAGDLHAGGLISPQSVTDTTLPQAGQTIVGVALTPAQLPGSPLQAGARVRIILTPRQQDDLPKANPVTVDAVVVSTRSVADTSQVVVDVSVPVGTAAKVASIVATARVALVLDGSA